MTHFSNAAVDIKDEGLAAVIPDFSGWLVDDEDAKVIYTALTIFLLSIPQDEFRSRVCEINRKFKDCYHKRPGELAHQEGGAK